jgi:hypothetical protein
LACDGPFSRWISLFHFWSLFSHMTGVSGIDFYIHQSAVRPFSLFPMENIQQENRHIARSLPIIDQIEMNYKM